MHCEICGAETQLYLTSVEGTTLKLCNKCSSHGTVQKTVQKLPEHRITQPIQKIVPEVEEVIVENYADIMRQAREKRGLKQEDFAKLVNEKESLIHHIETSRIRPDIKLGRKLEHFLGVKLVEELTYHESPQTQRKDAGMLTLGDIVTIKKR